LDKSDPGDHTGWDIVRKGNLSKFPVVTGDQIVFSYVSSERTICPETRSAVSYGDVIVRKVGTWVLWIFVGRIRNYKTLSVVVTCGGTGTREVKRIPTGVQDLVSTSVFSKRIKSETFVQYFEVDAQSVLRYSISQYGFGLCHTWITSDTIHNDSALIVSLVDFTLQ